MYKSLFNKYIQYIQPTKFVQFLAPKRKMLLPPIWKYDVGNKRPSLPTFYKILNIENQNRPVFFLALENFATLLFHTPY